MSSDLEHEESAECQLVISENFHASDADVVFRSSDNVLFHIHRKNLEIHTGAFPPSEFQTNGEVVSLTEDSSTLERLFQYVYPQRHPDIESLEFVELYKLAEAAEKYEVFGVMAICKSQLRHFIDQFPAELLNYAFRHNYPDILERATSLLLDVPLDQALTKIFPDLVIPWVLYRESWIRKLRNALGSHPVCQRGCHALREKRIAMLFTHIVDKHSSSAFLKLNNGKTRYIASDCLDNILATRPKFDPSLQTLSSS
ncbi:hypothetical protein H0H92_005174 [Tricholoma furcatifolium]|nr:hypothetical protein H0H92_005174 [Tricholoma furcatifolium]